MDKGNFEEAVKLRGRYVQISHLIDNSVASKVLKLLRWDNMIITSVGLLYADGQFSPKILTKRTLLLADGGKIWGAICELVSILHHCHAIGDIVLTHLPLDKMAAILADDIFKCIFLNEKNKIPIQISLKLVPRGPIDNKPALVQVMVWRRTGDKPLPEPMMAQFTDTYMWY